MNRTIIAPSILAADPGNFSQEIKAVAAAGADWIHIDVMDGSFVPPITFGANIVKLARSTTDLPLDVHLMIAAPERHIDAFADAGANTITVHIEASPHINRTLQAIRNRGMKAGVALNPGTPAHVLDGILSDCDLILVMTVNPGWGGQKFICSCVDKIKYFADKRSAGKYNFDIEVDGGIDKTTAKTCCQAGANVLVAGSYIYGSDDYANAVSSLRG